MKFSGMTLNERLYTSGKMEEFDKAVKVKDKIRIILILKSVEISSSNIDALLKELKISSNK